VPEISSKRMKMEIYPPIRPEQIYRKSRLKGDIMLLSERKSDGTYKPKMFHLINLHSAE
jgi:hypothetical protein